MCPQLQCWFGLPDIFNIFGLQKIVSLESLSRRIRSFNATTWEKEQWIPAHPMCASFFSTLCVDRFVVVVVTVIDWWSIFVCGYDWALFNCPFIIRNLLLLSTVWGLVPCRTTAVAFSFQLGKWECLRLIILQFAIILLFILLAYDACSLMLFRA